MNAFRRASEDNGLKLGLLLVLLASASCTQEPASNDGLDPDPAADTLAISPQNVSVSVGDTVTFSVPDETVQGTPVSGPVDWTVDGPTGAVIDSLGAFYATEAGEFDVQARRSKRVGRSHVVVMADDPAPVLTSIRIEPDVLTLQPGAVFTFVTSGVLSDGTRVPIAVNWSATGGTVTGTGRYTAGTVAGQFRVIVTQQGGNLADTSRVTISAAAPTLSAIELSPPNVSLAPGTSQQFSAVGRFSDGSRGATPVTWTATGGSISPTGWYTAAGSAGTFRVIATQQGGSRADTSTVTIAVPPPTVTLQSIVVSPASVGLQAGTSQQFSAVGHMSDGSISNVAISWSATGGSVSGTGWYTASSTAGTFRVIATQQGGSKADTASVTITAASPTLSSVVLTPASVTMRTGASQQFSAVGRMSDGSSSSIPITWSSTGGSISTAGLYTAGTTAGAFRVIATQQGGTRADTSAITITPPAPTLTAVEVTPATATVAAGATRQFSAIGRMSDNSTTSVAVTWSATGGSISSGGLYTAGGSAGSFRVIATQQGGTRADTSAVTVTSAPSLAALEVTPAPIAMTTGSTRQFTAVGRMSDNSTTSVTVTWAATGGTITSGGLYTAGSVAGSYRVIATQQGGSFADTSAVTLTVPPPSGAGLALTAHRLAAGSGTTLISAGVPLQPGQLQPGNVSGVGLWRNGSEVGASITALEGRYADGSVISLLVQYDAGAMTKGTAVAGYELRFTGSSVGRVAQNAGAIKDVPDGVWALPPAHFKAAVAPVWGPVLPLSETTGTWAQVDADWVHAADRRWETCGEQVTGTESDLSPNVEHFSSKYDQPKNRIIYWARGGDIKNLERGLRQAAVSRTYQANWQQWNNQDVLSMGMAYWWTGVASYRARVLSVAQGAGMNQWMGPPSDPGYDEGRITARNMGWALQAWLLGYGSSMLGNFTALQWLDGLAQRQVTVQQANGAWYESGRGVSATSMGYPNETTESNFMAAMRAYYLSLYLEYRGGAQVAGVSNAIRRNADFLSTQYDATARTWHYWSTWAQGDVEVGLADMRNLALMHTMAYYRAYHDGYGAGYLTQADAALASFAANVPNTVQTELCGQAISLKIYNEGYYLYQHAMAMANGL